MCFTLRETIKNLGNIVSETRCVEVMTRAFFDVFDELFVVFYALK